MLNSKVHCSQSKKHTHRNAHLNSKSVHPRLQGRYSVTAEGVLYVIKVAFGLTISSITNTVSIFTLAACIESLHGWMSSSIESCAGVSQIHADSLIVLMTLPCERCVKDVAYTCISFSQVVYNVFVKPK